MGGGAASARSSSSKGRRSRRRIGPTAGRNQKGDGGSNGIPFRLFHRNGKSKVKTGDLTRKEILGIYSYRGFRGR